MLDQTKTTRRGAPIGGKQQHLNFLQKHQVMKILEGYCRTGDDGYPVTAQNVAGLRVRAIGKFPHARQLHGERGELEARVAKLEATVARLATLLD